MKRAALLLTVALATTLAYAGLALAQRHGAEILFTYQHSIKGYAARFPEGRLDKVRADEQVAYVEPDETAYAQAQTLPWGINRIDADVSSTDAGNGSGAVSN